jgi:hypothetical protein
MSNRRRSRPGVYRHHLRESATAVVDAALTPLAESSTGGIAETGVPRRYRARLIETDRWGSSGWYGRDVVGRDGPGAWPVGTHLYADHPTLSEESERPERSIRDIAAYVTSTPVMESDGLYADIEVVPHHAAMVHSLRKVIGLSIRADGLAESGTRQGRTGPIVTAITRGHSVDLVTKAGAGGKLVSLLEAARTPGTPRVDLSETTADQTRAAIERAVRAAYAAGGDTYAWVRDYDPDRLLVWFDACGDGSNGPGTWEQSYAVGLADTDIALIGDRRPVVAETVYRPVAPPGPLMPDETVAFGESADTTPTTTDVTDGAPPTGSPIPPTDKEPDMSGTSTGASASAPAGAAPVDTAAIQLEAREAASARDKAVSERDTALTEAANQKARADKAEAELATFRAVEAARPLIAAQLAEAALPVAAQNKVTAGATARVPLTESGQLDVNALRVLVEAEVTAEKTYLAQLQEASGAGAVTGFGQTPAQQPPATASWATPPVEPNTALVESYKRRGLSAEAALLAAQGRAV